TPTAAGTSRNPRLLPRRPRWRGWTTRKWRWAMRTRVLAVALALCVFALVAAFIWATVRTLDPRDTVADQSVPTAEVSEVLPDGRIDVQVYALGNRDVRLDIQFTPDAAAIESAAMRPDVTSAMTEAHMGGLEPTLQRFEA